jgi:hypothetical protein
MHADIKTETENDIKKCYKKGRMEENERTY